MFAAVAPISLGTSGWKAYISDKVSMTLTVAYVEA